MSVDLTRLALAELAEGEAEEAVEEAAIEDTALDGVGAEGSSSYSERALLPPPTLPSVQVKHRICDIQYSRLLPAQVLPQLP